MWVKNKWGITNYVEPRFEITVLKSQDLDVISISPELKDALISGVKRMDGVPRDEKVIQYIINRYPMLNNLPLDDNGFAGVKEEIKEEVKPANKALNMVSTRAEIIEALKEKGIKIDWKIEKLAKSELLLKLYE